jgi:arylsulfatase A-like enzyme
MVKPYDNATSQSSEERTGTIPGIKQQTNGQLATNAVERLDNFSSQGIGKDGGKTFFLAAGFHKPHAPWIVLEKYFDLYDSDKISMAPSPRVPVSFLEENWRFNGNLEIEKYDNDMAPFNTSAVFGFNEPVNNQTARELRHACFAATSFLDAQVGRMMSGLDAHGYTENTIVTTWSNHGYRESGHLPQSFCCCCCC